MSAQALEAWGRTQGLCHPVGDFTSGAESGLPGQEPETARETSTQGERRWPGMSTGTGTGTGTGTRTGTGTGTGTGTMSH